ncbi:VWA domain-containing protein [Xylanibacillus composti]|uniref:VWFA domain-containing protein n=1 Tax=Xylanibacillus composti TaxID=1572762 RepID=A0A8J4LZY7_9BACL|nr:vWA domain-containing protein [Xylanibacillus composti]MDT9725122.1 VWA domain-containing protein [Xylanibacillus composti]GIQ67305.1 hypothetical protein XYCOK13_01290 [Xylanibacillus composti]
MKQIILITDGCSNVGVDPAAAAAQAYEDGIVVNVIGVLDGGDLGERGAAEVERIAAAGGGMSRLVHAKDLARTVQMMTRQTVAHTIRQVVHTELSTIMGKDTDIAALPPDKRAQVVEVMDQLNEKASLQVALLIDASGSMRAKLPAAAEAVRDLMLSLQARRGKSELAVFHYPGSMERVAELDHGWSADLQGADKLFQKLNMKGTTPTGPAIIEVLKYMGAYQSAPAGLDDLEEQPLEAREGLFRDYMV